MRLVPLRGREGNVRAYALIDEQDYELIADRRWYLTSHGYAQSRRDGRHIYMHRELLGLKHGDPRHVDHRNGNKLDNRRSNIRTCEEAENHQNINVVRGSSRYRGVYWSRSNKGWVAMGVCSGKRTHLGTFEDEDEAGRVASAWRRDNMPFSHADQEAVA